MESPIIVALDMNHKSALELAKKLDPRNCKLKVGSQLFTSAGPRIIEELNDLGFDIFLDLKFHDIPNTVKRAVEASFEMGIWMLNVHSLGGTEMLRAASEVINEASIKPLLIGVTILTSFDDKSLKQIGINSNVEDQVLILAELCQKEGIDGVVCSPHELSLLRSKFLEDFILVAPGIRSSKVEDDQKRTASAHDALKNGADYIVLGRDVTSSKNPADKISKIIEEI